jgi:hypothetical protein
MTDVVIDNKKHYGPQNTSNGRIIAIAVSPTQWTIAVAYQDETLVMVPLPELHGLRGANESFDQLVAKMAQRLGMDSLMIDFAVAANVIPLAGWSPTPTAAANRCSGEAPSSSSAPPREPTPHRILGCAGQSPSGWPHTRLPWRIVLYLVQYSYGKKQEIIVKASRSDC